MRLLVRLQEVGFYLDTHVCYRGRSRGRRDWNLRSTKKRLVESEEKSKHELPEMGIVCKVEKFMKFIILENLELFPENAKDELEALGFHWDGAFKEFLKIQYDPTAEEKTIEFFEAIEIQFINRGKEKTFHWITSTNLHSQRKYTSKEKTFYSFDKMIEFLKQNSFKVE